MIVEIIVKNKSKKGRPNHYCKKCAEELFHGITMDLNVDRIEDNCEICGEKRGSYSKTDKSATFMRIKTDYMGNDQLLPAYNLQIGVCEEYIATIDVKQYASDMDCFVPLMEKFNEIYGKYPKYPIADAMYV